MNKIWKTISMWIDHLVQEDSNSQRNAIGWGNWAEKNSTKKSNYDEISTQNPVFIWRDLLFQIGYGVKTFFIIPLKEFAETIGKKRDNNLRRLLIVQILAYSVYWSVTEYGSILYLYMLKVRLQWLHESNSGSQITTTIEHNYNFMSLSHGHTSRYLTHLKLSSSPS